VALGRLKLLLLSSAVVHRAKPGPSRAGVSGAGATGRRRDPPPLLRARGSPRAGGQGRSCARGSSLIQSSVSPSSIAWRVKADASAPEALRNSVSPYSTTMWRSAALSTRLPRISWQWWTAPDHPARPCSWTVEVRDRYGSAILDAI